MSINSKAHPSSRRVLSLSMLVRIVFTVVFVLLGISVSSAQGRNSVTWLRVPTGDRAGFYIADHGYARDFVFGSVIPISIGRPFLTRLWLPLESTPSIEGVWLVHCDQFSFHGVLSGSIVVGYRSVTANLSSTERNADAVKKLARRLETATEPFDRLLLLGEISLELCREDRGSWRSESGTAYVPLRKPRSGFDPGFSPNMHIELEADTERMTLAATFIIPGAAKAAPVLKKSTNAERPAPREFSIGSHESDVLAVQGTPDTVTHSSPGVTMLFYGLSSVTLRNGIVTEYRNTSRNLHVKYE